jgi:glycosyltransferase involved in cell wall biosynthesis
MKISIITVSHNSELTIADTLNSVATQTYQDIEHILVDGKSIDSTLRIAEIYAHPNLLINSESDNGIYDAMNKGFCLATGEVIGFLNSDDFFADTTIVQKIADAFKDKNVEACFADLVYVTRDNSQVLRYWKSKPFVRGDFAKGWSPAHPTFYIRRSALKRLGLFDQSFKLAADVEFMMRYLESGSIKSVYIPHLFVRMRIGGISNQTWENILIINKEISTALKKNDIPFITCFFWGYKILNRSWQFLSARLFFHIKRVL